MGMDVYGLKPVSERGKYFRASIWMWGPIWERMAYLCSDLLDYELVMEMAFNCGCGPRDQETCDKIAGRLEAWLGESASEEVFLQYVDSPMRISRDGRLLSNEEVAANPKCETKTPYIASRTGFQEFIDFLRSCGGFCVW